MNKQMSNWINCANIFQLQHLNFFCSVKLLAGNIPPRLNTVQICTISGATDVIRWFCLLLAYINSLYLQNNDKFPWMVMRLWPNTNHIFISVTPYNILVYLLADRRNLTIDVSNLACLPIIHYNNMQPYSFTIHTWINLLKWVFELNFRISYLQADIDSRI